MMSIRGFRRLGPENQGILHQDGGSIWSPMACTHIHPHRVLLDRDVRCPDAGEAL